MDESLAWERLASARVARLATVDSAAQPHIVPIVFAAADGVLASVVDHKPKESRELRRLENIRTNPLVSVLVDAYTDDWEDLWWVRVDGRASIEAMSNRFLGLLMRKYPQYQARPPQGPFIVIQSTAIRGWSAAEP